MAKKNHRSSFLDRWLDSRLGPIILAIIGFLRRKRDIPLYPRRIGLVQPTAIGDLILDSGLIIHLKRLFPLCQIHIFVGKANIAAAELVPESVHVHLCHFRKVPQTVRELRSASLDVLLDMSPWSCATAIYAALSGAATIGFDPMDRGRGYAFDKRLPYSHATHEIENLRKMAECFGACPSYELRIADIAADLPDLPYDRLILCHVAPGGSRARDKSWPPEFWAALADRLAARGYVCAFTGVGNDAHIIQEVLRRSTRNDNAIFSLCGKLTLPQMAAALRRSRLFVTVDTGVAHLAAAMKVPMVELHGPTRSVRWGAYSDRVVAIDSPHPAAGFVSFGFETSPAGHEIMRALTVDAVEAAVLGALEQWNTQLAHVPT